mmetsp:Transcript_10571/g.12727  ORF Transcript_10571/g.12727 Transcript_10571/m.12727 type:complete len:142 (-) Transcript_10571:11-436(-)
MTLSEFFVICIYPTISWTGLCTKQEEDRAKVVSFPASNAHAICQWHKISSSSSGDNVGETPFHASKAARHLVEHTTIQRRAIMLGKCLFERLKDIQAEFNIHTTTQRNTEPLSRTTTSPPLPSTLLRRFNLSTKLIYEGHP